MNSRTDSAARTGPLVIKLGGLAVDDPARAGPLLRAVVALHEREPRGVVLVHGGGKAIDRRMARLNLPTIRAAGLRVTPADQIDEVVATLAGVVNKRLVAALNQSGARAVGLCLGDGGLTTARRLTVPDGDLGLVGEITGGDPGLLQSLLADRFLAVLSPIAQGEGNELLNVNADDAATAIASIVGARLLVLLTDVSGVLDGAGQRIPMLDEPAMNTLIHQGVIHGGMIPKVRAALAAARQAGTPALIASWGEPEQLLSLSSGQIPGTLIMPSTQEPARQIAGQGAEQ